MDVNQVRIVVTVLSFVAFVVIWVWAWSRKSQAGFDEAARLPFVDSVNEQGGRSLSSPGRPKSQLTAVQGTEVSR